MSGRGAQPEFLYHEKQLSALCGVHALNNLLQGPYFAPGDLADIARGLDQKERDLLGHTPNQPSNNPDPSLQPPHLSHNVDEQSGDFSFEVLNAALGTIGLTLSNMEKGGIIESVGESPQLEEGFLCHSSHHWFALRSVGGLWFSLDSRRARPLLISDDHLSTYLALLRAEGQTVHVVRSTDELDVDEPDASARKSGSMVREEGSSARRARLPPPKQPDAHGSSTGAGHESVWHPIEYLLNSGDKEGDAEQILQELIAPAEFTSDFEAEIGRAAAVAAAEEADEMMAAELQSQEVQRMQCEAEAASRAREQSFFSAAGVKSTLASVLGLRAQAGPSEVSSETNRNLTAEANSTSELHAPDSNESISQLGNNARVTVSSKPHTGSNAKKSAKNFFSGARAWLNGVTRNVPVTSVHGTGASRDTTSSSVDTAGGSVYEEPSVDEVALSRALEESLLHARAPSTSTTDTDIPATLRDDDEALARAIRASLENTRATNSISSPTIRHDVFEGVWTSGDAGQSTTNDHSRIPQILDPD